MKGLVIFNTDYSNSAIGKNCSDVLSGVLSPYFHPRNALDAQGGYLEAPMRCCVSAADISSLFSSDGKLSLSFGNEYDFVIGVGNGSSVTWYAAGDCVVGDFAWITTTSSVIVPVSPTQKFLYLNFKKKNGGSFDSDTTIDLFEISGFIE